MSLGWEGVLVFAPEEGGRGGKGTPLIICAAEQAMVFKVLSLKQGVQFQYEASWTGCRFGLEAFNEC